MKDKCKCGNKLETTSKGCYMKCGFIKDQNCFIANCFQSRKSSSILCNHHEMKWRSSKFYITGGYEAFFSYIKSQVIGIQ